MSSQLFLCSNDFEYQAHTVKNRCLHRTCHKLHWLCTCVCFVMGGCTCMHTEMNGHSHFYVLASSKLLALKTDCSPRLKGSTPFAQVCACPLCFTQS